MIIVISQSKLLHCVGLWIWHTSYRSATPTFYKYFEVVICHLVRLQRSSQFSLLHHNCCCPFIKHDQQKQCLQQRKLKVQCLLIGSEHRALLHNHRMRNAHMCILAIVMATCSYQI